MTFRRRTLGIRGMLLAAAVAAALPTVRWCPLRWEQIDAERFLRCTTMVAAGLPTCGPGAAATTAAPDDDCRMPCAARAGVATCPLAETATSSTPQRTPPARRGHAYVLGDAAYAHALRSTARLVAPPLRAMPASLAVASLALPSVAARRVPLAAEPRPPNRAAHAPPPARAPPLET